MDTTEIQKKRKEKKKKRENTMNNCMLKYWTT